MGFDVDLWDDIYEKLYVIVKSVPDFKNNVFQGDRYPADKYPCAFIVPASLVSKPITMNEDDWYYTFEIGIGYHGDDPTKNLKEAFRLASQVTDAIVADRHLSIRDSSTMLARALVQDTHVAQIIPDWNKYSKGLEVIWIGLVVICRKKQ
jgi:hypothetical protein